MSSTQQQAKEEYRQDMQKMNDQHQAKLDRMIADFKDRGLRQDEVI